MAVWIEISYYLALVKIEYMGKPRSSQHDEHVLLSHYLFKDLEIS